MGAAPSPRRAASPVGKTPSSDSLRILDLPTRGALARTLVDPSAPRLQPPAPLCKAVCTHVGRTVKTVYSIVFIDIVPRRCRPAHREERRKIENMNNLSFLKHIEIHQDPMELKASNPLGFVASVVRTLTISMQCVHVCGFKCGCAALTSR